MVGLTEEANIKNVNLAYPVEDGQKIYIPFKSDVEESINDKEVITETAGGNVLGDNKNEKENVGGTININTASKDKLKELPGIRKFYS